MVWTASVESTPICCLGIDCALMLRYPEFNNFFLCVRVCVCVCMCVCVYVCVYVCMYVCARTYHL